MIQGRKPNGYTLSFTAEGKRVEAETRQCVHCQFSWTYGDLHLPEEMDELFGHPTRRGYCCRCRGWLCARTVCIQEQVRLTGNTADCISYQDRVDRLWDKVAKHFPLAEDLTITAAGVVIPRHGA